MPRPDRRRAAGRRPATAPAPRRSTTPSTAALEPAARRAASRSLTKPDPLADLDPVKDADPFDDLPDHEPPTRRSSGAPPTARRRRCEVDAGEPEAGGVDLGGGGQVVDAGPQAGQALLAGPLDDAVDERLAPRSKRAWVRSRPNRRSTKRSARSVSTRRRRMASVTCP